MKILLILCIIFITSRVESGILYPKSSSSRQLLSLDGLWKFSLSTNGSFDNNDFLSNKNDKDLHLMPVPSSYNDIITTLDGRDHLGPVKYERTFYIPSEWLEGNDRVWIRFGSVCYSAEISINEKVALSHSIGHLPFQGEITSFLTKGKNTIAVIVDNTLTPNSMPQGSTQKLPNGRIKQTYSYDFFNYAGIDRSVYIYKSPKVYVDDITITTTIKETTGVVSFDIKSGGVDLNNTTSGEYKITILDMHNHEIASKTDSVIDLDDIYHSVVDIDKAKFWWPYLMNDNPAYLYTLRVELTTNNRTDQYDQKFGIRELTWNNSTFLINGQPIYFRGLGRHEDSDIRGKGLDLPLIVRDHNLMRWMGVNSYRTSHYPYAEEIMNLADSLGIMILDEVPCVNTHDYNNDLLENHKRSLTELYQRDKNRPSVVMWSIANEPDTRDSNSKDYYNHIAAHIKSFDKTRPISLAMFYDSGDDHAGEFLDIICFNKYEAWYISAGDVDVIVQEVIKVADAWRAKHNKLVMLTEYGADSLEGLHSLPAYIWSEEFHLDLMSKYFEAFDQLRAKGWFIGEMIWNFADFKTSADRRRVGGNRKGVFTRQRQPKATAHFLRKRYWSLANRLNNVTIPSDIDRYVIKKNNKNLQLLGKSYPTY